MFWPWIDAKYFGGGDWFEDRIQLFEKERKGIEEFVRRKLEEREKQILHHGDIAKDHIPPIEDARMG